MVLIAMHNPTTANISLFLFFGFSKLEVAPFGGSWIRHEVSLSVMAVPLQQAWMTAEDSDVAMGKVVFSRALGSVVDIICTRLDHDLERICSTATGC